MSGRSGWLTAGSDKVGERRNQGATRHSKPTAEVIPEGNGQLCTGLGQAKEGIATAATISTASAATDLALGDLAPEVSLGAVGMQRDVRVVEHRQQFDLVCVQPLQQSIQRSEAGATAEDVIKPRTELLAPPRCGVGAIVLQIGIQLPDQRTNQLLLRALLLGKGLEFVDEALRVYPTECVPADRELAGIVADDHRPPEKLMRLDAAP